MVVVLEGFDGASITASWEPGDEMSYPVSTLDEQLSALRIAYSADTQRLEARDQTDKTNVIITGARE